MVVPIPPNVPSGAGDIAATDSPFVAAFRAHGSSGCTYECTNVSAPLFALHFGVVQLKPVLQVESLLF